MSAPLVGLVDYGMGNQRSVEKALEHVRARVLRSGDPDRLAQADALVLPGVGAFPEAMRRLRSSGLDELLRASFERDVPMLGICLGMQLAFEESSELGGAAGLGLLAGEVRELRAEGLNLPHIGWNVIRFDREFAGLEREGAFYHVHSFTCDPRDAGDVLATAEYGERFVTAVERGPFVGVQFHPEKSSAGGLRLLSAFVSRAAHAGAPA